MCLAKLNKLSIDQSVILVLLSTGQNEELYKGKEGKNTIKLAWILSLDRKKKKCHRQRKGTLDLKYNESDFSEQTKQLNFVNSVDFSLALFFSENITLVKVMGLKVDYQAFTPAELAQI